MCCGKFLKILFFSDFTCQLLLVVCLQKIDWSGYEKLHVRNAHRQALRDINTVREQCSRQARESKVLSDATSCQDAEKILAEYDEFEILKRPCDLLRVQKQNLEYFISEKIILMNKSEFEPVF